MTAATGTTGAAATRPRRRLSVEQRREQLIAVALDIFSRHPPEEVSIDDIAAAAGASRPLVYHYFPGKQALYEEAIRRAGEQLAALFEEPRDGALTERLLRVMGRYLDFVDGHGPGFAALLRNASPAASPGTSSVVDQVRHAAERAVLDHLELPEPSLRMRLAVRTWIGNAEITALAWLADQEHERLLGREELQLKLVQEFVVQLLVAQMHEPELRPRLRAYLTLESPEGPAGRLLQGLIGLMADEELADEVLRLSSG